MALYTGRLLMRGGNEADFDPSKMMPREWAVSTDKKIVRICIAPGVCIRMATYEAFEEDMAKIEEILKECQSIQEAVIRINEEVSKNADAVAEYTAQAKQYRDEAKQFRDEAFNATPSGYENLVQNVADNTVKIDTVIQKAELNIRNTASGENIHLTDSADSKAVEFALYGNATQNGMPTPENPVDIEVAGSSGSVVVKSCWKNLCNITASSKTVNGVTFTINDDKSITLTGTSTARASHYVGKTYLKKDKYIFSQGPWEDNMTMFAAYELNNKNIYVDLLYSESKIIDLPIDCYLEFTADVRLASVNTNGHTLYPMLRPCDENGNPIGDDTYEPYKETSSTIPTPNGLAGIPVESGGNYTDENGQQRVCDVIVKYANGSGEYIQRIKKFAPSTENYPSDMSQFTGVKDNHTNYRFSVQNCKKAGMLLCNIMPLKMGTLWGFDVLGCDTIMANAIDFSMPYDVLGITKDATADERVAAMRQYIANNQGKIIFYYELATPIRTSLTAEEIAEIEKLCTFYPVTNISNDSDCGMEITYMADAKNYIDNRLALIETAMLSNI